MIADAGYAVATDEPNILVADAIADTLTGALSWDRRYDLGFHLCSVVRTRTSNQIKRAKRRMQISLEALDSDGHEKVTLESIDRHDARPPPDILLEMSQIAHALYRVVRERAAQDAALHALLDAYALGIFRPREVMKLTALTRTEFLNARRRLDRKLVHVPPELRRAALDAIRSCRRSHRAC